MEDNFKVSDVVAEMLARLGIKYEEDENFKNTPLRVEKMYNEIIYSKEKRNEMIRKILATTFPSKYPGMIVSSGVRCYSLCGHHLLPISLDLVIGYIPSKRVLGLSKLARLADVVAKQPLIQEDFTEEIADEMFTHLKPQGVGVYVEGLHYCQTMRGVKQRDAIMTTISLKGNFLESSVKQEFMEQCKRKGV